MFRFTAKLLLAVIVAAVTLQVSAADRDKYFHDYPRMLQGVSAKLRDYMKTHPGNDIDSVRRHLLATISDTRVASRSALTPPRKKKLTPEKLYEEAMKSSLVFGKMHFHPQFGVDTAYSTASAVALTPDGICATNYHVVSDIVINAALDNQEKGDMMRFVMDSQGRVYPMTAVLAVDPVNDMAIIKVDPCGDKLSPAPVGDIVTPGTKVFCLANPSMTYFHFTDGMVSNCIRKLKPRTGHTEYILEITADYGKGASGGPIYDECGNLVSIVSSTVSVYADDDNYRDFQMAFKQTIPVFLIKDYFND